MLKDLGSLGLFLTDTLLPALWFPACPSKAVCHSRSSCFAALGNFPEGGWPQSAVILKAFSIRDPVASKDSITVLNPQKVSLISELNHCCYLLS